MSRFFFSSETGATGSLYPSPPGSSGRIVAVSFYRGNHTAVKRPDIPAKTIVLAAIKLDIRKRPVRFYEWNRFAYNDQRDRVSGVRRASWRRERGIIGWLVRGQEEQTKRIHQGQTTKLSSETNIDNVHRTSLQLPAAFVTEKLCAREGIRKVSSSRMSYLMLAEKENGKTIRLRDF